MTNAIVRPPARSITRAINSWYARSHKKEDLAIDYDKARRQHQQFVTTLERLEIRVFLLDPDEAYPDGCFVQDPILVAGKNALVLRQAAPTRQGEHQAITEKLQSLGYDLTTMKQGICDGGDVLIGHDVRKAWVGMSRRTDEAGFREIHSFYQKCSYEAIAIPIKNCLHLSTGATYLGDGRFLAARSIGQTGLEKLSKEGSVTIVPVTESRAANVLVYQDNVVIPEGYPDTKKKLEQLGFTTHETPLSEFEKADGGTTCLSLIFTL